MDEVFDDKDDVYPFIPLTEAQRPNIVCGKQIKKFLDTHIKNKDDLINLTLAGHGHPSLITLGGKQEEGNIQTFGWLTVKYLTNYFGGKQKFNVILDSCTTADI